MISLCESEGRVYHRLFVSGLAVRQVLPVFVHRLTETGDVTVSKYAEHGWYQSPGIAIAFAELYLQVFDERLCHRQTNGFL